MANLTKWMENEKKQMMTVWPDIVGELTNAEHAVINNKMKKILEYNVLGGKQFRALILIYAYQLVTNKFTKENMRLVRIVAWCMELTQAAAIMIDDLQDQSLFRRGNPCWYRCDQIELAAITDALKLKHSIFYLIKKHCKGKECYVDLMETFEETSSKTVDGQILDLQLSTNVNKKPNLELFTMDTYNCIVRNKTSYYSVVLPITIAMHLAGIKDRESFMQAESISLEIGRLFQIQDDFLDCFGDSEVSGKDSTDIQDGKCTWFVVEALQRATPEQRKILEECYGFSDPEKVKRVKQLYTDLNLQKIYTLYENKVYNLINKRVQQMSCGILHELFVNLLKAFYHRKS
ncbi:farnesyl pyrophosphate synthase isoform X2 [Solenopsis invicta]|uniref:farnesyl pyrophosphate synthase isoform X2 n=1 Tax=Solenopsis invicta TaxID=13686 RepID=UPI00193D7B7C|nr:farnesyl pyrophosphate synthase isoform X2 [Solenopsis invicta]